MTSVVALLVSLSSFLLASSGTVEVTPVQKVIQLMEGMLEKGKKEKHEEQVQFASFKQFCDDTSVEKKRAIEEAYEKIDMLKADIQKHTAAAAKLTKEIAGLDEDVSVWTGDIKAATSVRNIEKADYDKTHEDYTESIDALERAIETLKKQTHDRKQASFFEASESFVQIKSLKSLSLMPEHTKHMIDSFLSEQESDESLAEAPEANAYEFQSNGVIEMLAKLLDKFTSERTQLEKEEMNAKHAFDMLMQDLNSQIAQAEKDRDSKAESKAKNLQAKADASGNLKDTTATRNEDSKYLADLTATCEQKASDFQSRQELRSEEIEAIEKAIEIISSGAVSGNADKHLPSLVQTVDSEASSFSQLRAESTSRAQVRVVQYLQSKARKLNSRVLSTMATRMEDSPFTKVKKMIKDLIVRLMEEANEEAEHKGWCDTELSTNEQTRIEKTDAVETLHAEIDQLEASMAKLSEEITDFTKAVADLDAAMAKATKLRTQEKEKNTETAQDADEAQAASEYEQLMEESKKDRETKRLATVQWGRDKSAKERELEATTTDQMQAQEELDAALAYHDKLKPDCIEEGLSFEERAKMRQEEIDSLNEAYDILDGFGK